MILRKRQRSTCVRAVLRQRRRNGSGIVSGDIRREVVRDEPRADRLVLPGSHDEEVPKGERARTLTVWSGEPHLRGNPW